MRVTIQQAAANAFVAWLAPQMLDIVVEPRWPAPDKKKPALSISLVTAGRRRDTPIDLRVLKQTDSGPNNVTAVWQLAACTQPFQLDVWALSDIARDDVLARLDDFLHVGESSLATAILPNPVGIGNLIAIGDGWDDAGAIADFIFEEPSLSDTADAVGRNLYRATFRGNAHFMLTVTATSARQKVINFNMRITESDQFTGTEFPVAPITA